MTVLPITMDHVLAAGALPGHHHDPFDLMLIAQGQIEGLPIVTSDRVFHQYSVELGLVSTFYPGMYSLPDLGRLLVQRFCPNNMAQF